MRQRVGSPLHGVAGALEADVRHQHGEFIATQPERRIGAPAGPERRSDRRQDLVSPVMSVSVVDGFEIVEIEDRQDERRAPGLSRGDFPGETVIEVAAIS